MFFLPEVNVVAAGRVRLLSEAGPGPTIIVRCQLCPSGGAGQATNPLQLSFGDRNLAFWGQHFWVFPDCRDGHRLRCVSG